MRALPDGSRVAGLRAGLGREWIQEVKLIFRIWGCLLLLGWLALAGAAGAEPSLVGMAGETLNNQQAAQKEAEEWSREERELGKEIAGLERRQAELRRRSESLELALKTEEQRLVAGQRRLVESQKLRDGLLDWLRPVCQRLAERKAQGTPFLSGERRKRFDDLDVVLSDSYTPPHEQFRRVFEALLVETEYGFSNEVYREEIVLDGRQRQVDLLRIGRLALFFRTLDQKSAGVYDPGLGGFRLLPVENVADISRAMAIVRRETAAELVSLPIGRIVKP